MASLFEASCFSLTLVTELVRELKKVRAARCHFFINRSRSPPATWAKHGVQLCPERGHRCGATESTSASRRARSWSPVKVLPLSKASPLDSHRHEGGGQNVFTVTIIFTVTAKCRGASSSRGLIWSKLG